MKVREINDYSQFLSLYDSWNTLLANSDHSIFATWIWLSTWWKHFGAARKLKILVAEENGELIGIAPLMYYVETMLGLRRGKIEFIGTPDSDYNNFIVNAKIGKNEEVFRLFFDYLNNTPEKWALMNLEDIPENSECLPFLKNTSNNLKQATRCSYLPLPESYELFLKNLSCNQRHYLRSRTKKLEKEFSVKLVDFSQSSSCAEGLRILIELHQKRWTSAGFYGAFSTPTTRNFHFDVAESMAKKNLLGLYILELDDKPVSGIYGFKYQSKYCDYLPGYDPAYSKYGVGSLVTSYLIDKVIQEGLTEFDLMRGDDQYKDRWDAIPRWNYQAVLNRNDVQSRITGMFWRRGQNVRNLIGRIKSKSA